MGTADWPYPVARPFDVYLMSRKRLDQQRVAGQPRYLPVGTRSDAIDAWWLRWEIGFVVTIAGLAGLPVALGIAILKYRLHEIDLIVNRALVYATLTAVLAGVFEITLVTVQHVLLVFTHVEDSRFAYFATAMVMASLFEPLKRRIDALVERWFYSGQPSAVSHQPKTKS